MGQIQTETPYYQPNPPAPYPFTTVNTQLHDPDFTEDCQDAAGDSDSDNSTSISSPSSSPPCAMAWGLRMVGCKNMYVFGAGLYSFFNNYSTDCCTPGEGERCQARIAYVGGPLAGEGSNVSSVSDLEVYNLNTVGALSMVNRDGTDVVFFQDNVAGFTSCVALFRFEQDQSFLGWGIGQGVGLGQGIVPDGLISSPSSGSGSGPGSGGNGTGGIPGLGSGSVNGSSASLSSNSGYMCLGNWQQLCGPAATESTACNSTLASVPALTSDLPLTANTVVTQSGVPTGSGSTSSGITNASGTAVLTASGEVPATSATTAPLATPSAPLLAGILPQAPSPQTTCTTEST